MIGAVLAMLLTAGTVQATDVFNLGAGLTSLSFVTVGNPGNAPDVYVSGSGGYAGSVGYTYQMGTYDVTAAQYCQFLNAVAKTDTYGLYNSAMSGGITYQACGINQVGGPGNYSYNTTSAYSVNNGNFPVNWVSWGDAARFSNWLTNGQPTGPEGAGTTETGSYTLNGATSNAALMAVTRNANANYVIPTDNEWYKAAYYDPTLNGGAGGYWLYPTRSNTPPSNVLSSTGTNNANFMILNQGNFVYTDLANYLTVVGAFAGSPGPYGTYDMGGDVWQWNEANISNENSSRGLLGGGFESLGISTLKASTGGSNPPTSETSFLGFRVAELEAPVPEPLTMVALGMGITGLGCYIRRRRMAAK
jgi:formylglycine-generating enzyme required for sulfatase activity